VPQRGQAPGGAEFLAGAARGPQRVAPRDKGAVDKLLERGGLSEQKSLTGECYWTVQRRLEALSHSRFDPGVTDEGKCIQDIPAL
jgi:hypothetical protein